MYGAFAFNSVQCSNEIRFLLDNHDWAVQTMLNWAPILNIQIDL